MEMIIVDNINLSIIDINGLEQFYERYDNLVSEGDTLIFETGNYGMLLHSKLIDTWCKEKEVIVDGKTFIIVKPNFDNTERHITYHLKNKVIIKIVLNEQLDLKTNIMDMKTGFPITSETLYFKQIIKYDKV